MEPKESTYLLCGNSIQQVIRMNPSRRKEPRYYPESMAEELKYYTAQPVSMGVRLCVFWSLWAMLFVVVVLSILAYCCFIPQICVTAKKHLRANVTNDVNIH